MRPRHQHIHGAKPPVGRKHLDHSGERGLAPSPEPIVVITCIIASSESWGPYQRPHPWHSRAGGGAVHSINSGHRLPNRPCPKSVESRCGAVALGRTYLLPPLSFGGASMVPPWLRFHIPLIEPDRQISRIRLSDKTSRLRVQRLLQLLNIYRS